ncbi:MULTISPECIES: tetratricopeptide repeat protein [Flavobacterium]|uniref:tetratricopeptide repeat protein n=1 Tax=Flavobacterium TaxID=237 RepID=UPI002115A3FA|nr:MULTISPECIES: tetratricopeptide repeat protein [Flavobacterium]UUF16468.1 tetratricopeptide repeat protein [Flavobacterium panici]
MNALEEISNMMNDADKKAFIQYLSKKNKRKDTGNIELFNSLKTDDIKFNKKILEDKKTTDAYHALRKRLYDNMINFMANRSFENDSSEENTILRFIVVSRLFFEHKLIKTAFKCLAKAEEIALSIEHFSLLNEIYLTQIQFAHFNLSEPIEKIIEKFKANKKQLEYEEQLNLGYAILRRELAAIYHEGRIVDFQALIKNTIETHGISLKQGLTFKSLYQILFIANEYASINNNYSLIQPFVVKSYRFISQKTDLTERHLYYHIYILYFIANFYFRNGQFTESLNYLELMLTELQKQSGKYYQRFCLRYFLLLAFNENYLGNPQKAIEIAEKSLSSNKKADPNDSNDIRLMLIVFYIQQNAGRNAVKEMAKLNHTDSWYEKKMGMDWTIKKHVVEILLHTQQENIELALSRIKSFKRRYKKYLLTVNEERVIQYLLFVEQYVMKPEIIQTQKFQNAIEDFIITAQNGPKDILIMSFLSWLLAKVRRKTIYETTLNLLTTYFPAN